MKSIHTLVLLLAASTSIRAASLVVSSPASGAYDYFGYSVSISGGIGLVGAYGANAPGSDSGEAYSFSNLDTASGVITQNYRLKASDGAASDLLGRAVSVSGSNGLVGAPGDDSAQGSAYLYRGLNSGTGTKTENIKLTASDGTTNDSFGNSVSLSGGIGLVGATGPTSGGTINGSAYVYRDLDTYTNATKTQDIKLTASDGALNDQFGSSVSISGNMGLVGARWDDDKGGNSGSAYVYRGLNTYTNATKTQDLKLIASDGASNDEFGASVSLSGTNALIGARQADISGKSDQGAAYVFRGLDSGSGTKNQSAKLVASDGTTNDQFGNSVSLSGSVGLVGAQQTATNKGAAYLFRNLDTATGTVTEFVKLTAADGVTNALFGSSVSIDGDLFLIGSRGFNNSSGKAYSGSVSSLTTLNTGGASNTISGINFSSREDWIIGQNTSSNKVTLAVGSTADITASGKAVYIGKDASSDLNILTLSGTLIANEVYIGELGNEENKLVFQNTASFTLSSIYLAQKNFFSIQGDYTNALALLGYLGTTDLNAWNGTSWEVVSASNFNNVLEFSYGDGFTTFQSIPEPSSTLSLLLFAAFILCFRRRKACRTP